MAKSMTKHVPRGQKILEIGSHYLHSSMLLSKLGYSIYASDVETFITRDFVKERAEAHDIVLFQENDLEALSSQKDIENEYDVLLFTEIMEHITFNPINFWKQIYRVLKPESLIYISTPNGLSLTAILRAFANILSFRGIGIGVGQIFENVTYGHHWKMYSAFEIRRYFRALSDDFTIKIRKYSYDTIDRRNTYSFLWTTINWLGNKTYFLATDLEAIVKLKKSGSWKIEPPNY